MPSPSPHGSAPGDSTLSMASRIDPLLPPGRADRTVSPAPSGSTPGLTLEEFQAALVAQTATTQQLVAAQAAVQSGSMTYPGGTDLEQINRAIELAYQAALTAQQAQQAQAANPPANANYWGEMASVVAANYGQGPAYNGGGENVPPLGNLPTSPTAPIAPISSGVATLSTVNDSINSGFGLTVEQLKLLTGGGGFDAGPFMMNAAGSLISTTSGKPYDPTIPNPYATSANKYNNPSLDNPNLTPEENNALRAAGIDQNTGFGNSGVINPASTAGGVSLGVPYVAHDPKLDVNPDGSRIVLTRQELYSITGMASLGSSLDGSPNANPGSPVSISTLNASINQGFNSVVSQLKSMDNAVGGAKAPVSPGISWSSVAQYVPVSIPSPVAYVPSPGAMQRQAPNVYIYNPTFTDPNSGQKIVQMVQNSL